MQPYYATFVMSAKEKLGGGLLGLFGEHALRLVYLLPLFLLWKALFAQGVQVSMTLAQMLTYTCISSMFSQQLNVRTPASSWLYEGVIIDLYKRPMGVFGQLIAHTMGGWIPTLLLFTLPLAVIAGFLGISLLPKSGWFFVSFALSISLGFSIDFLFSCMIIRMRNSSWTASVIRGAITSLFSGALIPFALLPWGIGPILQLLPFASLAGAPLAIFAGIEPPLVLIVSQILWNIVLWPFCTWAFAHSRQVMVSYGG